VRGKYHNGTSFVWYTMTAAYDHKNRRIFKSVLDEDSTDEAHWFFYYDQFDRLIEIKHVPDIDSSSTYTVFQFYWIDNQPVAYWQIDDAGGSPTTTRRYWHTDEINRPLEVWTYPTGGATATRVWAINPDLFGWDDIVTGSSVYQPLRFPGQYFDEETVSWENSTDPARPALHYNWHRTYDPYTGTYVQVDPMVEDTWEAYNYVGQNPVEMVDRTGLSDSPIANLIRVAFGTAVCMDSYSLDTALCNGITSNYWATKCECMKDANKACEACYAGYGIGVPSNQCNNSESYWCSPERGFHPHPGDNDIIQIFRGNGDGLFELFAWP
jgi:RHS repeat-associated protein